MNVDIVEYNKECPLSRKELRSAVKWIGRHVLGTRINVDVDVHVKPLADNNFGFTYGIESGVCPRMFQIMVDPFQTRLQFLRTLAHEMVHVHQFARGIRRDYARGDMIRWKKRIYKDTQKTKSVREYNRLPWEVEARKREKEVAKAYLDHLRDSLE